MRPGRVSHSTLSGRSAVAVMLVPEGWDGQVSFGKGVKRSVLFSPGFIEFGDERPIEAEHELPAIALAIAAVKTRP